MDSQLFGKSTVAVKTGADAPKSGATANDGLSTSGNQTAAFVPPVTGSGMFGKGSTGSAETYTLQHDGK